MTGLTALASRIQSECSAGVNEHPPNLGGYRMMTTHDQLWIGRRAGTSVSGRKSPVGFSWLGRSHRQRQKDATFPGVKGMTLRQLLHRHLTAAEWACWAVSFQAARYVRNSHASASIADWLRLRLRNAAVSIAPSAYRCAEKNITRDSR